MPNLYCQQGSRDTHFSSEIHNKETQPQESLAENWSPGCCHQTG